VYCTTATGWQPSCSLANISYIIADEIEGVEDKGSRDTRAAEVQTLLEALFSMSLRSAYFTDEAFFFLGGGGGGVKVKLLFLGLHPSSARLSEFLNY
jgi:hypothetical protein